VYRPRAGHSLPTIPPAPSILVQRDPLQGNHRRRQSGGFNESINSSIEQPLVSRSDINIAKGPLTAVPMPLARGSTDPNSRHTKGLFPQRR
jgi:hypothetical protein